MNKTLLTGIVGALFLVCSSYQSIIFAEEFTSTETIDHAAEMEYNIEIVVGIAHWLTGVGTVVLAVALIRTFKHMEAVTKMTSIETEYRLRPWIGPTGPIKKMEKSISDDCQFDVAIKNYGEIPAGYVTAKFVRSDKPLTRESFQSDDVSSYDLGPVMPTMEKHYWFFIDSEIWKKADSGSEPLYTAIYFEYSNSGKKCGYGMLSEYSSTAKNFIHKDMWID
ncbi:MAG TPA: hypothetical protein OQH54_05245 [Nitrosopumilus sp.]|nr:hypothetical protein [Thermoproteota archaeon]HJJ23104.1 hypothetical protein [Nitrosopumilus sp.]